MQNSIFIAKLIGPVITAFGLTMLLNRDAIDEMVDGALRHKSIIVMAGAATLLVGLAIVNTHNVWSGGWPVVITVFGWLAVVGGLFRVLLPGQAQAMGELVLKRRAVLPAASAVWLGFGVWLSYMGYVA